MYLTPEILLHGYCQGIFPMAHEDDQIYWYDPDPRAILPLDAFHIPRSLARTIKRSHYEVRVDTAFSDVIHACAYPAPGRGETWINQEIITAYSQLHHLGFVHSVETWLEGKLVGGLYGVAVRGLFAGESMFSQSPDASKVALVYLVERLVHGNYQLLDVQFLTTHLQQFGAIEIPRREYQGRLAQALTINTNF